MEIYYIIGERNSPLRRHVENIMGPIFNFFFFLLRWHVRELRVKKIYYMAQYTLLFETVLFNGV